MFLQASGFFVQHVVPRACGCGDCVAFNVPEALRFIGLPGDAAGAKFRAWVKQSKNGCTNRKMNLTVEAGHTKTLTCCHVKKSVFSNDLLQKVQKGQFFLLIRVPVVIVLCTNAVTKFLVPFLTQTLKPDQYKSCMGKSHLPTNFCRL